MSSSAPPNRVDSMDQFRGFTVLSMFLVNFVHHMDNMHPIWKHNKNYFTFADWIMPGFIFAVGFSYRLTILRRLEKLGPLKTYSTYVRRSMALVLVSLMMYGFGGGFKEWDGFSAEKTIQVTDESGQLEEQPVNATGQFIAKLIKSNLWEVLAIIGVCQIFVMPVIARGSLTRLLAMIGCIVGHIAISCWYNWGFVHGYEHNWMVQLWQTGGNRCWDGGFFGIMSWSIAMLAGTLTYDMISSVSRGNSAAKIFRFGALFMIIGYGLSCGTRLYDVPLDSPAQETSESEESEEQAAKPTLPPANAPLNPGNVAKYADNPMIPDFNAAKGRSWTDLLAEPPFVMPPDATPAGQLRRNQDLKRRSELSGKPKLNEAEQEELAGLNTRLQAVVHYDHARKWNYWMMYKTIVSVPFILFSTGFSIALFALFIIVTDLGGLSVGVFRTFGMNPLAAYVLHSMIAHALENFVPSDAPAWYCWSITGVFFLITYLFVRHLEKQNVFIRL